MSTVKPDQTIVNKLVSNYANSVDDLILMRDEMVKNVDTSNSYQMSKVSKCLANFNTAISIILNPLEIEELELSYSELQFLSGIKTAYDKFDTGSDILPSAIMQTLEFVKSLENKTIDDNDPIIITDPSYLAMLR